MPDSERIAIRVGRLRRDHGISVARPTPLGNPFPIASESDRAGAIERYRAELPLILARSAPARMQFARVVAAARTGDVTLLCWCAPKPCHAEVIATAVLAALAAQSAPRSSC